MTTTKSESIVKLMTALSTFQRYCPDIPKTKTNPHLKNKYAGLEDILATIRQPLREAGLVVSQLPGEGTLTTLLAHFESGEFISSTIGLSAASNNAQAVGSALTYARRYSLAAILGLPIGEDDDGTQATKKSNVLTPKHPMWGKSVQAIRDGRTVADARKKFEISEANAALLIAEANA